MALRKRVASGTTGVNSDPKRCHLAKLAISANPIAPRTFSQEMNPIFMVWQSLLHFIWLDFFFCKCKFSIQYCRTLIGATKIFWSKSSTYRWTRPGQSLYPLVWIHSTRLNVRFVFMQLRASTSSCLWPICRRWWASIRTPVGTTEKYRRNCVCTEIWRLIYSPWKRKMKKILLKNRRTA